MNMHQKRAVVLVSGGMDSAVTLALAREARFACHALSVAYGQRHTSELAAAARIAQQLGAAEHKTVQVDLRSIGGSALTADIEVPEHVEGDAGIPVTYVPARNTIMLSIALGWAEVLGANDLFCGVNAVDYSGYPDCRPEFVAAFEHLANLATKAGVEGAGLHLHAPLIRLSKADIVREGLRLGVDFSETVSCYRADTQGRACGHCDACFLRAEGFRGAGAVDTTRYALLVPGASPA
ncbi:MAG: 7-cyano-7-deazaguanine synthase QueC [Chiayiivirga sp.]|jgi:7-cyano-7-deazaguanine synthase|nr:7-cyano-7-deazaguanine synthase QueC [Chiayiivirga sp.]